MELQIYGVFIDFLGVTILLLFSDPLIMSQKINNQKEIPTEKLIREYRMKRYFALVLIVFGFIVQAISLLSR